MKHLNEYIYEELQINEMFVTAGSLLVYALCGACISHFGIKGLKKIRQMGENFWNWAIGEKDFDLSLSVESLKHNDDIIEEKNFDKTKVQPMQIPNDKILQKLLEKLKTNIKKKQGFYIFDKLFNEMPELKQINKPPYYANYVIFMDAGNVDNESQKPNFYGMLGFSLKYWKTLAKKSKDNNIKAEAQNLIKYINIFAVQTSKKYASKGLFEIYLEDMKNAVKETKMEGLTIKYEDEDTAEIFKKYGFKKIDNLNGYMILTTNKQTEK